MRERLTFANVMSCVAVFLALGGTALAIRANSVGSRHVKDNSLQSRDVKDGALQGVDLAADSVGPRELDEPLNNFQSIRMGSDAGTCNPTSALFIDCGTVTLPLSEPSQVLLTAGGGQRGNASASGSCRFQADSQTPLSGSPLSVGDAEARLAGNENGFALTAVAGTVGRIPAGNRTFRLLCNELDGDISYFTTLSVVALGDGLE